MFPAIRDCGLGAASREKFKKQISFIKIHYNYEKFSRQSEDLTTRRMLVQDLQHNYPEITDIDYDTFFSMDLMNLHTLIEIKKLDARLNRCARMI